MKSKPQSYKERIIIILVIILVMLTACQAAWGVYVSHYNPADEAVVTEVYSKSDILISNPKDDLTVFAPKDTEARAGIIFYPGARVESSAYDLLLSELAEKGLLCVLVNMPQNMAILNISAANGIMNLYPEIDSWYMAGHSMGAAMAAVYISHHADEFDGLIMLAGFSVKDLSDTGLRVLSIYGSEDGVLNRNKYVKEMHKLPAMTDNLADALTPGTSYEYIIDGGCHAYFGCYGAQNGDGIPEISNEEQIHETVDIISDWIA